MNLSFYIWYKVAGESARARAQITAMQIDLADATGVAGRLLVRADDPQTWMEIYEDVDDPVAFERELDRVVTSHDALLLAPAGRHVERFCACGDLPD